MAVRPARRLVLPPPLLQLLLPPLPVHLPVVFVLLHLRPPLCRFGRRRPRRVRDARTRRVAVGGDVEQRGGLFRGRDLVVAEVGLGFVWVGEGRPLVPLEVVAVVVVMAAAAAAAAAAAVAVAGVALSSLGSPP